MKKILLAGLLSLTAANLIAGPGGNGGNGGAGYGGSGGHGGTGEND